MNMDVGVIGSLKQLFIWGFILAFDRVVFYRNVRLTIVVISTKKRYSRHFLKDFSFTESLFLKTFKIVFKISSVIGPLCSPILFVLTLTYVSYENDAFSMLVLSTKKRDSIFLKRVFIFQKICFKVKKRSKLSHENMPTSEWGKCLYGKSWQPFVRRTIPLLKNPLPVSFNMKPLRKSVFLC